MIDPLLRPLIDPPLRRAGRALAAAGDGRTRRPSRDARSGSALWRQSRVDTSPSHCC